MYRFQHRMLSMGPLYGILKESLGKKSSVPSKAPCSSRVVDTQASHPQKRTKKKKREGPLLHVQGSGRTAVPCPYSNLLSPSGPMVPANPFPALHQGFCLWLEKSEASVIRCLSFLQFPGDKDKCSCLSLKATVVKKKDSSLQNTGPSLCPYEFPI